MEKIKNGFTLIELLVVVLIIGILAAIAVPQYQKAVLKSRFSSLVPLAKTLNESNEAYYMEHGTYANNMNNLDVRTSNNQAEASLGNEDQHKYVLLTRSDIKNNLRMYQKHSANFPGETHCEALIDDAQANWLCRDSLKGTFIGNKYGYAVYAIGETDAASSLDRIYYSGLTSQSVLEDGDICTHNEGAAFACRNATLERGSKCITTSGHWNCNYMHFNTGSVCFASSRGSCVQGTFDNAYCVGNAAPYGSDTSCGRGNTFSNYSICYAKVANTCTGDYDSTSCCMGDACTRNKCEDNAYWKARIDDGTFPEEPTYL